MIPPCLSCQATYKIILVIAVIQLYSKNKKNPIAIFASMQVYIDKCTDNQVCKLFALTGKTVTSGMLAIS